MESNFYKRFGGKTLRLALNCLGIQLIFLSISPEMYARSISNDVRARSEIVQRTITGTVSDENGEPLQGANVVEQGTTNGISTDANGRFSLSTNNANVTLAISFIGYT